MGYFVAKDYDCRGLECVGLIDDAVECILENDERPAEFREKNAYIQNTFRAILPDVSASEFQPVVKLLQVIAEKLGSISPTVDISDVLEQVSSLLDKSVKVTARHVSDQRSEYKQDAFLIWAIWTLTNCRSSSRRGEDAFWQSN